MRVAFLTALFPVLSDIPFMNQIVGLLERGHQVDVYADGPQPGGAFHPDVERLGLQSLTRYPLRWPAGRLDRWRAAAEVVRAHRGAERRTLLRTLDPSLFWHRAWTLDQLRRTARFLLPVCDFLGRRLVDLGAPPDRVVVHRTGIDLRRWPYREREPKGGGHLRLVTVGRLVEKKGIEYVLRAVRILVDRGLDIEYRILGDGPRRDRVAALVAELGLEQRVVVHGRHAQEK